MLDRKMLVIDEDVQRSLRLQQFFQTHFIVDSTVDSIGGLIKAIQTSPNVALLGHSLSKLSSLELCQQIRQHSQALIMIVLEDQLTDNERIAYFEAGADDVVHASISGKELLCKVNVLQCRMATGNLGSSEQQMIQFGPLTMNKVKHKAYIDTDEIMLTRKEFAILWTLITKHGQIVSRNELLKVVWSYDHFGDDRMIDTHLNRIRKKLQKYNNNISIKTVWGVGYKIERSNVFVIPQKIMETY